MTECILWDGPVGTRGYGWTMYRPEGGKPRSELVHRAVYELLVGPLIPGMTIDHLCRVKLCTNYHHLEQVTRGENVRRHYRLQTHCKMGHSLADAYIVKGRHRRCRPCALALDRKNRAQRTLQQRVRRQRES